MSYMGQFHNNFIFSGTQHKIFTELASVLYTYNVATTLTHSVNARTME